MESSHDKDEIDLVSKGFVKHSLRYDTSPKGSANPEFLVLCSSNIPCGPKVEREESNSAPGVWVVVAYCRIRPRCI